MRYVKIGRLQTLSSHFIWMTFQTTNSRLILQPKSLILLNWNCNRSSTGGRITAGYFKDYLKWLEMYLLCHVLVLRLNVNSVKVLRVILDCIRIPYKDV